MSSRKREAGALFRSEPTRGYTRSGLQRASAAPQDGGNVAGASGRTEGRSEVSDSERERRGSRYGQGSERHSLGTQERRSEGHRSQTRSVTGHQSRESRRTDGVDDGRAPSRHESSRTAGGRRRDGSQRSGSGEFDIVEFERQMDAEFAKVTRAVQETIDEGRRANQAATAAFAKVEETAREAAVARRRMRELVRTIRPRNRRQDDQRSTGSIDQVAAEAADLRREAEDVEGQRRRTAEFVRRQRAGVLTAEEQAQQDRDMVHEDAASAPKVDPERHRRFERVNENLGRDNDEPNRRLALRDDDRRPRLARGLGPAPGDSASSGDDDAPPPRAPRAPQPPGRPGVPPRPPDDPVGRRDRARGPQTRTDEILRRAWRTPAGADARPNLAKLGIKLGLPDPYDGASNTEEFEEWLGRLIRWFRTYSLDEKTPEMDEVRCQVLGQAVKGKAASFLQRHQDELDARGRTLTFDAAIRAIRDRFLYRSTALDAAHKYETLSQGTRDVQTLADDLRRYAERMTEPPAPYGLRRRFLQALKPGIAQWLLRLGISPETHSWSDLVSLARNIEESDQYARAFQSTAPQKPPVVAAHTPSTTVDSRARFLPRPRLPNAPGSLVRPPFNRERSVVPRAAPGLRPGAPPQPAGAGQRPGPVRPGDRGQSVPRVNPMQGQPLPGSAAATGHCFNCGTKGHYANSCPLPKRKPQGFAARVVDDNDDEDKPPEVEPPAQQNDEVEYNRQEDVEADVVTFEQDDNPEGDQYDPFEGPEQLYWSELEVDDYILPDENQELEGYAARVVPLDEILKELSLQAKAVTTAPSKENTLLSTQARRKIARVPPQPTRDPRLQKTINVFIDIGGVRADVLIDCGSTTDMMTPQFARVARTESVELEVQMGLRLAVRGSHSKLNFGAWADVTLGHIKTNNYFDVVNLDRHDVVLGTPFLWTHKIYLGFEGTGVLLQNWKRIDVASVVSEEEPPHKNARSNLQFFRAKDVV